MSGFDVIALGSDISTQLAAALLATEGCRVLLAPGRGPGGARLRCGPHALEPRSPLLTGLDRPMVRRVLDSPATGDEAA